MYKLFLMISILFISVNSFSDYMNIKVIYGEDGRVDVFESYNSKHVKLARSTAAMVSSHKLVELNNEQVVLSGRSLVDNGICSSERFSKQPTAANCSGFIVQKDVLITAGHCVRSQSSCESSSWVFDYVVGYADQNEVVVDKSNVYKCKNLISHSLDQSTGNDYAVIELDRKVEDREPLEYRKSGRIQKGESLVVIGHPSGLPTKITTGGIVRDVKDIYMVTNLDTYGGNSGSAVFNSKTGIVEGILVRGDTDYVWNHELGCRESNRISNDSGRGEDVTLMSSVKNIPQITPPEIPLWWQRFLAWLDARNR